jgi:hypothetical protein
VGDGRGGEVGEVLALTASEFLACKERLAGVCVWGWVQDTGPGESSSAEREAKTLHSGPLYDYPVIRVLSHCLHLARLLGNRMCPPNAPWTAEHITRYCVVLLLATSFVFLTCLQIMGDD